MPERPRKRLRRQPTDHSFDIENSENPSTHDYSEEENEEDDDNDDDDWDSDTFPGSKQKLSR